MATIESALPRRHVARERARRGWGWWMYEFRRLILALGVLILLGSAIWGPGVVNKLSGGGFDVPGSESYLAQQRLEETVGRPGADVVALYSSPRQTVNDPGYKAAVADVVQAVQKVPGAQLRSVSSYWTTGSPALVSADRHSTLVAVQLHGDMDTRLAAYGRLKDALRIDSSVASTRLGGPVPIDDQLGEQVAADLTRAESVSAPLLTIMLIVVFGGLVAAGLPLLIGGMAVVVSFVVLRLLLHVTDVLFFAINIITIVGLGLSIDYALLVVSRFREEIRAGRGTKDAVRRTVSTAGRSVIVSATIVIVSMSGLMFFPPVFLRSMAFGGMATVAVAAISALTILPALLAILGPKVDSLRLFGRRRAARHVRPTNRWARLAHDVMRRPVLFITAIGCGLLLMASPGVTASFGGIDERQMPASAEANQVKHILDSQFPPRQESPLEVVVEGADAAQLSSVTTAIRQLPHATNVQVAGQKNSTSLVTVGYPGEAIDPTAREMVTRIRQLNLPPGVSVMVGGFSAEQVDLRASMVSGLWKMLLLVVAVTMGMLFWAFGSLVLPIKAVAMTMLTIVASFGVVVAVFQHGHGAGILGFTPTGTIEATQPILVLAILFGVTTDYEVFLLSRIREEWDRTKDNTAAVAAGLQRTGPIITSAAALILIVIVAFSTSKITFIKLIGVGMAVSILLDATIIRALLVPATMRLLGRWNWWLPPRLDGWWRRHRPAQI